MCTNDKIGALTEHHTAYHVAKALPAYIPRVTGVNMTVLALAVVR